MQQIEILLAGYNPYAADAPDAREAAQLRAVLGVSEHLLAFVRGRIAGAGAGLWVLTDQRLLELGSSASSRSIETAHVQALGLQQGRYGMTLALQTQGRRFGLYGADAALSTAFAGALAQAVPALQTDSAPGALSAEQAVAVADALSQARARLQPAGRRNAAQVVALLSEAASLRERGVLDDAELGVLKGRLLAAT